MINIRKLDNTSAKINQELNQLKLIPENTNNNIKEVVSEIIKNVRSSGDNAILKYTTEFDKYRKTKISDLEIPKSELIYAEKNLDKKLRTVFKTAIQRIRKYHKEQKLSSFKLPEEGGFLGYRIQPLARVALYVPGGKAVYPSSLLMNAIPAKVAGVKELVVLNPAPKGEINQTVLACANMCGVNQVINIGGAQAIAGVAYGTNFIKQCDKVVGPGNAYVAEAKRQVFGAIGIDMIAGPSEVLIISDGSGNPSWTAADLLAQAEHDELAQSILLCTDKKFIIEVEKALTYYLKILPRAEIIKKSLKNRGALIFVKDIKSAINISDFFAPEHLIIACKSAEKIATKIKYAGGIFLGHHSCEVLGDYCAGTNHVLPTSGSARFSSPLSVYDFYKGTAILNLSASTVKKIAPVAEKMAISEGLQAHALAAKLRF